MRGFTLIETALIIVLLGALAAAFLVPIDAVRAADAERLTRTRLAEIRAALVGYARAHGRLPCPADPAARTGTPAAGVPRPLAGADCAGGYAGVVPWVVLGTAETDAWSRRFSYRVARDLANAIDECGGAAYTAASICPIAAAPMSSPANRDALEVRVRTRADRVGARTAPTEPIATGLAVVIVSHGANGHFGATASGLRSTATRTTGIDEQANADPASVSFMSARPRPVRAQCADEIEARPLCEFDDLLEWVGRAEIMHAVARR